MRRTCLTRALDQWNDNPAWFWLWYNSNHVIAIEIYYNPRDLVDYGGNNEIRYLPMSDFGYEYFVKAFNLSYRYRKLLRKYLQSET